MFSKLAVTVLVALVGLSGLHVAAAEPHCPSGKNLSCCSVTLPEGYYGRCTYYNKDAGCSGELKCCVYNDNENNGFGCSAPNY